MATPTPAHAPSTAAAAASSTLSLVDMLSDPARLPLDLVGIIDEYRSSAEEWDSFVEATTAALEDWVADEGIWTASRDDFHDGAFGRLELLLPPDYVIAHYDFVCDLIMDRSAQFVEESLVELHRAFPSTRNGLRPHQMGILQQHLFLFLMPLAHGIEPTGALDAPNPVRAWLHEALAPWLDAATCEFTLLVIERATDDERAAFVAYARAHVP